MPDDFVDRVRMHDLAHREAGGVPRRLLASWQRSEDYGVPLEEVEPVFTGTDDLGSLFFQCGNEVLADLHSTLAGEPVSLMLTDAEGVVLSRLSGDRGLLQALDDVHLAPGFALRRARRRHQRPRSGARRPGADAGARRPALRTEPVHVHLRRGPVFDPASGRLEGSVNLTTWSRSSSDLLLALARSAASNTTALMLARPWATARGRRRAVRFSASRCRGWNRDRARCTSFRRRGTPRWPRRTRDGGRPDRRRRRRGRLGPGHAARAGRAAHLSAGPHPVGQCTRADRCADVAGSVGAGTRQGPHRGHRPRRRHVAGLGGRTASRPDPAQRRLEVGSVRGDGRAVRRHPGRAGRPGRCRRSGAAASGPPRRRAAAGATHRDAHPRPRDRLQHHRGAGAERLRLAGKCRRAVAGGIARGRSAQT